MTHGSLQSLLVRVCRSFRTLACAVALLASGEIVMGQTSGDFNGDGFDDLAVGVPYERIGGIDLAGTVHVLHGTATGLTAVGSQVWSQDSPGVSDVVEPDDFFGTALASGDFEGDGYDDLAVGVPNEDLGSSPILGDAGIVHVLYGSPAGLTSVRSQVWDQLAASLPYPLDEDPEAGDYFGASLAAGDINNDGYDDLAVGVPREDRRAANGGLVHVLYGGSGGLWNGKTQYALFLYYQENIEFGSSLTLGDFNGDFYSDLAVGAPRVDFGIEGAVIDAGSVSVFYGSLFGIRPSQFQQIWHQDSVGVTDSPEARDLFGWRLASGDFDGDGRDELVVGVPYEDIGAVIDAGAVHVLHGGAEGLTSVGSQFWQQGLAGVADIAEANDKFGLSLSAANIVGDLKKDLVIGVPGEDDKRGAVHVMRGTAAVLTHRLYVTARVLGGASANDSFAAALAAGDFNGDSTIDVAVGVPDDDIGGIIDPGSLTVLFNVVDVQFWHQDSPGIADVNERGDHFGKALSHN